MLLLVRKRRHMYSDRITRRKQMMITVGRLYLLTSATKPFLLIICIVEIPIFKTSKSANWLTMHMRAMITSMEGELRQLAMYT